MIENASQYFPTTIDNPSNPFLNWDSWYQFDQFEKGYRTCDLLDKFYKTSDLISKDLDEFMYSIALEKFLDLFPYYILVKKESEIKPIKMEEFEANLGIKPVENGVDRAN